MRWKSLITTGPYSPAVTEFWLSSTGWPVDVVSSLGSTFGSGLDYGFIFIIDL